MAPRETTRGILGESLLFMFTAAALAAAVSILSMFDNPTPQGSAAIATSYTVIAGILYACRNYCDEGKWKRFAVTIALAPMLVILSTVNVAHTVGIEMEMAIIGTVSVWVTAAVVAGIVYLLRWWYLSRRWLTKMLIKKYSETGDHCKSIQEAESTKCLPFQHRNYIEDPTNFSSCKSVALQLAQSLDAVNRPCDASRVRLVANGFTTDQANSLLKEQAILTATHQLHLIQPSNCSGRGNG